MSQTMATCAKCQTPLTVEIKPDEDEDYPSDTTQVFPDEVLLPCRCHFHWTCLLDSYELAKCPNCARHIVSVPTTSSSSSSSADGGHEQILVDLNNEGGMQRQIDIFPILKEESYLRAYPEERKCRAFLEFCRAGDHRAVVDLLKTCSEQPGEEDGDVDAMDDDGDDEGAGAGPGKTADEILRYQDPIDEMQSGLHAAVASGNREVAWLLLLLASTVPELDFPALVFQEAAALGVMREDQTAKVDIRSLKDAQGRTAEDVAKEAGVLWNGWIGNGRLAIP